MIYFIRRPDDGWIKIGVTVRLSERLKQLCAEFGGELEVLAVVDGSRARERELHRQFSHLRAVGEWFEPGDDLTGFIVAEGKRWDGEDEAPTAPVKIERPLAEKAAIIARQRRITIAEYMSDPTRALIERDFSWALRELEGK
jgi:hypothetical protein